MESYMKLDAYEEVFEVLKEIRKSGMKTVILSNGSKDMLKAAVKSAKLEEVLDDAFSVEEIKTFKPNKNVYKIINDKMRVNNEEVIFFSSNGWDIAGASSYGFNTIWVNRFSRVIDKLDSKPDKVVKNLKEAIKFLN